MAFNVFLREKVCFNAYKCLCWKEYDYICCSCVVWQVDVAVVMVSTEVTCDSTNIML